MDEHSAVPQHRVETETVGRRDREQVERAGDEDQNDQQESLDGSKDSRGVRGKPQTQPGARHQRGAAQQSQDERPVQE